jgi:hypothetical protein
MLDSQIQSVAFANHVVTGGFGPQVKRMYDELSDGQLKWNKLDYAYDVIYNGKTGEGLLALHCLLRRHSYWKY